MNGRLPWNAEKFPSGMTALADYAHCKGLELVCTPPPAPILAEENPRFRQHEIDAHTCAEWGVDYLKYDLCFFPPRATAPPLTDAWPRPSATAARDIVFSLCNWG